MITKIGDKPNLMGRRRKAHIHRKCMMPPENMQEYAEKLDKIDWSEKEPLKRTYKIRVNGKVIYDPGEKKK
jgi:hypothetical protein